MNRKMVAPWGRQPRLVKDIPGRMNSSYLHSGICYGITSLQGALMCRESCTCLYTYGSHVRLPVVGALLPVQDFVLQSEISFFTILGESDKNRIIQCHFLGKANKIDY
jgi:hypothetical protein